nr:hypothetical protein [Mucilaginibacter sp. L294]
MNENISMPEIPAASNISGQSKILGLNDDGSTVLFEAINLRGDSLGLATTTVIPPITPLINQFYELSGSGTYANLLTAPTTPLVIPAPAAGTAIMQPRAYFNGTYWIADFKAVVLPIVNNKILTYVTGTAYSLGAQVISNGVVYEATNDTLTTDVPGISSVWKMKLDYLQKSTVTTPGKNLLDNSLVVAGSYSTVGVPGSAVSDIRTPLIKVSELTDYTLSGIGSISNSRSRIAFFTIGGVYISSILGNSTSAAVAFTTPATAAYVGISLASGTNIGVDPTNSAYKNTMMLRLAATSSDYEGYGRFVPVERISGSIAKDYSDIYVSFNPVGSTSGKELFTVYCRRGKSNHYVGYLLGHLYDMADLIYMDLWRVYGGSEYVFNGATMTPTGDLVVIAGENECVYNQVQRVGIDPYAKDDFTGGYHGDEVAQSVQLFINNIPVTDLATPFTLRPCELFYYLQASTMHECANVISGTPTYVPGHPVQANHLKRTEFRSGGYKTTNTLTFQQAFQLYWLHGIFCMGKMQATNGYDELYNTAAFTGSNSHFLQNVGTRDIHYYNTVKGFTSEISSTLLLPSNQDAACSLFVWDRTNDSKYYRQTPTLIVAVGDIWKSEMVVKHGVA